MLTVLVTGMSGAGSGAGIMFEPEDINTLGYKSVDELAAALAEGKTSLTKLKPLKPWFALNPPRHGFKRSCKRLYGQKGVLGHNKELLVIVKRMM